MIERILQRKDFVNDNEVRWCPGCGDYAILAALQKLLPELGAPPEKHVFVSGIGCSGRLPYYMNAFGFHTIHGRATAVATGIKAMRDDLIVWVITGDGDALSIGGNHLIHCLRRNVNINILLVNNQVYGLTKGQFSPTSHKGMRTKTSPQGVSSEPLNPLSLALASGASFVARAVDKDPSQMVEVLKKAQQHQGCSIVEIYQDCHIFNPGAFDAFTQKNNRKQNTVFLHENAPMVFGANDEFALSLNKDALVRVVREESNGYCHNSSDFLAAMRLARLSFPAYPVPIGVYYQETRDVFKLTGQLNQTLSGLTDFCRNKPRWVED